MNKRIIPKCKDGEKPYVSSEGRWLPCCSFPHLGKQLDNSIFSSDEYLIKNNTEFNKFHEKPCFKSWIKTTEENYDGAYSICKTRCSVNSHELAEKNKNIHWTMEEHTYIRSLAKLAEFLDNNEIEYDFEKFIENEK